MSDDEGPFGSALGGMGGLEGLLRKANEVKAKLEEAQARAARKTAIGEAGGGLVRVTANGHGEIVSVRIDRAALSGEDVEMLEDLVAAASNAALRNAKELLARELGPLAELMEGAGIGPGVLGPGGPGGGSGR